MAEPITFSSRLPGDAHASPSPSSSPSPAPPEPEPEPEASSSTAAPALQQPNKTARTIVLTSISPNDPAKRRDFEARYYSPPSSSSAASTASTRSFLDLPESYFTPTASELQRAHAQAISHREHLVDRPLLTSKLRQRQEAERNRTKAAKWPQTRIRVRFADRSLLEGVLPSTDKLVHLYEFVRLALDPKVRHVPFVLYQSPPRTEYRKSDPAFRGKTLMDLQFTPSTSLYIKFEAPVTPPTRTSSSSSTSPPAEASVPPVDLDALNFATRDDNQQWRPPLIHDLLDAVAELPLPPSFDPREPEQSTPGDDKGKGKAVDEAQKKKDKEDRLRRLLGGRKK
ncbi:hypothetical protein BMF94_3812 [Rhodotorula taiwanensis]|uniref:UBX domain-containing protein n=1 Tax=Rhodotorula taiwanensis TaxID=741276 RepID=A0A2S5B8N2_9BASI|nr:hypothetical protein BMF94_3812 [Rhodotorula taiwanensis]